LTSLIVELNIHLKALFICPCFDAHLGLT